MTGDPLERLARRQTVRRALAFSGISAAIVLAVVARGYTEPAPTPALSSPDLAKPVGGSDAAAPPSSAPSAAGSPAPATTPRKKHTHHPATAGSATTVPRTTVSPTHSSAPHPTTPPAPAQATHTTSPAPAPTTRRVVTGSAYDVGYGIVQVRVTVRGSTILDITAVSMPEGGHSGDITAMAEPQLRREAISAQSARINAVSGATYTSSGYAKSLQSALDKAAA